MGLDELQRLGQLLGLRRRGQLLGLGLEVLLRLEVRWRLEVLLRRGLRWKLGLEVGLGGHQVLGLRVVAAGRLHSRHRGRWHVCGQAAPKLVLRGPWRWLPLAQRDAPREVPCRWLSSTFQLLEILGRRSLAGPWRGLRIPYWGAGGVLRAWQQLLPRLCHASHLLGPSTSQLPNLWLLHLLLPKEGIN